MTQERTDRIETPDGNTHTTTVITDEPRRSGVSGWFLMFVVLLAVVVAIWVFAGQNNSEVANDNAVAEAASQVSASAQQVGNAAVAVGDAAWDTAGAAKDSAEAAAGDAQDTVGEVQDAASDAAQ